MFGFALPFTLPSWLTVMIPVPLALAIAGSLYGWYWHTTSVSEAVLRETTQMVTRTELETAKKLATTLAAERDFLLERTQVEAARAATLAEANADLSERLRTVWVANANLEDELSERIRARPGGAAQCLADDDLLNRLRNKRTR